jgi:hypothetical protein
MSDVLIDRPELASLGQYEFGWHDADAAGASARRGLSEKVVRDISAHKKPRPRVLRPVVDRSRSRGGFLWYTTSTQLVETSDHSVGTPVRRGRPGKPYKAFTFAVFEHTV